MAELAHKVTLSSGKVVILREPRIKHQELATQAAAIRSGPNAGVAVLGGAFQKEFLKLLLADVNGKPVSGAQLEMLDDLFTFREWTELNQVFAKLVGAEDDMGKFQIEAVPTGGN